MKTATSSMALLGLLVLAGCGEENTTAKDASASRSAEAPVTAPSKPAAAEIEVAEAAEPVAEPEPEPEPIDAIITFKGEDGMLELERADLDMVSPVQDAESEQWSVFLQLDEDSATDFYDMTSKTAGEAMSIVVDGMVVGAPILDAPVYGGGFVFNVENERVASTVVAALKGEEPPSFAPAETEIAAGDALPSDDEETGDAVANAATE